MSAAALTPGGRSLGGRRWSAPEVVQTSSMDCGPAALKSLLEGYGVPVSYGRLREACQTDIDGSSIDTLEVVAGQLGLLVDQEMAPIDHVLERGGAGLPAIVVVRHAHTATHFVVVWRRMGHWLQVMDPGMGRRWVRADAFAAEAYRHEMSVDAPDWRAWAVSEETQALLARKLARLGAPASLTRSLLREAVTDATWFGIGALDAAVRLVTSIVDAGGLRAGREAADMAAALFRGTCGAAGDIFALIPQAYWAAIPDATNTDPSRERLRARGAVLVRVSGLKPAAKRHVADDDLSPELAAALSERVETPLATIWRMLREDGLAGPLAMAGAMGIATAVIMLEGLLFRGLFSIGGLLNVPAQRLAAAAALFGVMAILLALEAPVVFESLRNGRRLEARLRMALLRKMPRLNDRYFQSRPISDMADRSHNIQAIRNIPALGLQFVQSVCELFLTFAAVALIAPDSALPAGLLVLAAMVIPFVIQPRLNEADLRVRNQAGALHGFYLDALLGMAPIRSHGAELGVRRMHEGLLVGWAGSLRARVRMALAADAVQAVLCTVLAGAMLVRHFLHAGGVAGADLLLVFWALKLPATGSRIAGLAHQYPAQRNILLRLLEPINAPEEAPKDAAVAAQPQEAAGWLSDAASVTLRRGVVVAGGQRILDGVDLRIRPGEHVAIVGVSGAGKSTLMGLLLGWHRLTEGTLTVNGRALDAESLPALRQATAWVDPGIQIWNRSLMDNLAYAADDDRLPRLGQALSAARLRGVAGGLPEGLQSRLGEGGGRLSGGEGQRVRLARAMLVENPRLVLLDEPFRGLDREQRQALLGEARAWWRETTLLCVTHDVAETRGFGRVIVMQDGRILEDGAPSELLSRPSRYRALIDAEAEVRRGLWQGANWRRLHMTAGRLSELAQ